MFTLNGMKKLILFSMMVFFSLTLVSGTVTFGNQTQVFEPTNGSWIRFEQDTSMEQLVLDSDNGQIIMDNVSNFNLTFTSLKTTDYSVILFLDILNKTGEFGNSSSFVTTTIDDFEILIEGSDTFTWLDYITPIIVSPSSTVYIYPDTVDSVVHIILGRRISY